LIGPSSVDRLRGLPAAAGRRFRALGADLPFADPAPAHGIPLEGWYLRVAAPATGQVVALMIGAVTEPGGGRWALVAAAVHPDGIVRHRNVDRGLDLTWPLALGDAVQMGPTAVRARVGDLELDLQLRPGAPLRPLLWGGLGPAQLVPGLPQYWTPLDAGVVERGSLRVGTTSHDLRAARFYREKNWGASFPRHGWWWGAAHAFADPRLVVAFAGGPLSRLGPAPTAVVVSTPEALVRLGTPLISPVTTTVEDDVRVVAGGGLRHRVRLEGRDAGTAITLPHPEPPGREPAWRARQAFAGDLTLLLERRAGGRWRTAATGRSPLTGLERGVPR
jgi:hypothetical protein